MDDLLESPRRKSHSLRYWYGSSITLFIATSSEAILGELARNCDFVLLPTQRDAWLTQIGFLKATLNEQTGSIFFEFNIPRMGRRIDTVLVLGPLICAIEFKIGEKSVERSAIDQVWDYGLDLKNFHEASHNALILPLLLLPGATGHWPPEFIRDADGLLRPIVVGESNFRAALAEALREVRGVAINPETWAKAPYHPTSTIIEAARTLYAQHSVEAIASFDAGAQNLNVTSNRIEELVDEAQALRRKRICFVTGVPGAGKTLVGLNLATRRDADQPTHAVFLSGNGPLVAVLREALTRDEVVRRKARGEKVRKGKVGESVKAFIQNVHHFRDDALIESGPPIEHVVIFDEAQRAWNQRQTANFMLRKKGQADFKESEPAFLISFMDRHTDWAVIVCLVGGGQEINIGEAGIGAWIEAVEQRFPQWEIFVSSKLTDTEYAAGEALQLASKNANTRYDDCLHLAVSMRSFRAENVSAFVKALLDCEIEQAREHFTLLTNRYPIAITQNLSAAKRWLRSHARGSERYGLVASSKAMRLKPYAIDIRVSVDPIHYFLNGKDDTRSSYYLEDAATEFQVQGLELDWACIAWCADFRFDGSGWNYHDFRGNRWCNIQNAPNREYLRNAYRVLLTRARQGMVIFIPPGDQRDPTRYPDFYSWTYKYLRSLGVPEVEEDNLPVESSLQRNLAS
ncbi:MAG: DUF2075 domain-containing protein [Chthoniobacterales bacterium]|nr:DUF2075 domain-containing protein [Chthoniobacterales bacterium]